MGKNRKKKGNSKKDNRPRGPRIVDDDTSVYSDASSTLASADASDAEEVFDIDAKIEEISEQLAEKRVSTRVGGVNSLRKLLKSSCQAEHVENLRDTLASQLLGNLRKGKSDEVQVSCHTFAALVLTLGEDADELFASSVATLTDYARNPKKSVDSRAAAVRSLSVLAFAGCMEPEDLIKVQTTLESLFTSEKVKSGTSGALVAEALLGFALVVSPYPNRALGALLDRHMKTLSGLLDVESLEVRTAAGEVIAMLYAAQTILDEKKEEAKHSYDIKHVLAKLQALAKDGSKHRAKKERRNQRAVFRDIVRSVEDNDEPTEALTIGKEKHTFNGWAEIRQLDAVRTVLGSGLNAHFMTNPFLSKVFGFDVSAASSANLTWTEQKAIRNQNIAASKQKARAQKEKNQKNRAKKKAHVLAGDD